MRTFIGDLPRIDGLMKSARGKRGFSKLWICVVVCVVVVLATVLVVCLWPGSAEVVSPRVEVVARIKYPGGSLECVDLYYGAIRSGNHRQYQVCLENPLPALEFQKKIGVRQSALKKNGFIWDVAPVKRGEPGIKGRPDKVWATSPWSGKEEVFEVVKNGQYWKIVEER